MLMKSVSEAPVLLGCVDRWPTECCEDCYSVNGDEVDRGRVDVEDVEEEM